MTAILQINPVDLPEISIPAFPEEISEAQAEIASKEGFIQSLVSANQEADRQVASAQRRVDELKTNEKSLIRDLALSDVPDDIHDLIDNNRAEMERVEMSISHLIDMSVSRTELINETEAEIRDLEKSIEALKAKHKQDVYRNLNPDIECEAREALIKWVALQVGCGITGEANLALLFKQPEQSAARKLSNQVIAQFS